MEHYTAGLPIVTGEAKVEVADDDADPEIVAQIMELLDTRVRPAVARDGGDITYHGPGQIVGYPILDLDFFSRNFIQDATVRSGLRHIVFPSSSSKVSIELLKFSPDLWIIYSESNKTSGSDKTKPLLLKVLIIFSDNFFDFIY